MNKKQLKKSDLIKKYTDNGFSFEEATAELDFAIEILCGLTTKDLIIGIMPSPKDIEKLESAVNIRLSTRAPMPQILGYAYFMGCRFEITKDTLIPRPETELLVRKAVELVKNNNYKQILDIGTGSGCIACMIAKKTNAQVLGVDISNEALKICLNNAMHLDLMNRAIFRKSDLFSKIREDEKFDMIVSNPPYIPPQDREGLQIEVKDHEPAAALFTQDEKGLEFYIKITSEAHKYMTQNASLIYEVGINQAEDVMEIMKNNGYKDINYLTDLSGIKRVVYGILENK